MFISIEETPNPNTLKFFTGGVVFEGDPVEFCYDDESLPPFAQEVLLTGNFDRVFLGSNFISLTKKADKDWIIVKPFILDLLSRYIEEKKEFYSSTSTSPPEDDAFWDEADADVVQQIIALLNEKVRPFVARDGGDIVFRGFREGVVYLAMRGACAGCPSSSMTLKAGVENMLKHFVPAVVRVEQSAL